MTYTILLAERQFGEKAKAILARAGRVIPFENREVFMRHLSEADAVAAGLEVVFDRPTLEKAKKLKVLGTRTTQNASRLPAT